MRSTLVDFPAGTLDGVGTVLAVWETDAGPGVVLDRTPCHPVDPAWPDQPADCGTLDGQPIVDCLVGAVGDESVMIGDEITVRRGDPEYVWCVVHVINGGPPSVGDTVSVAVDPQRRAGLDRAHTACHLSAMALNAAVAALWRKEFPADALGHPDFDRAAIDTSRMQPDVSRDAYRLGKSLRRKGFDSAALLADLPAVTERINAQLAAWIATDARVWIDTAGPQLTDLRHWRCALPEGQCRIACGGTHVNSLAELGEVEVFFERPDEASLVCVTTVHPS